MTRSEEAYQLKQAGHNAKEIASIMGLKTAAGARSLVSEGKKKATIIQDDLYYPSSRDINDVPAWADYLKFATKNDKILKIMFWADMHIPDTSWQSVELARQLRRYIKPNVDFFLGDEDDLDTVSTHWARAENRKRVDAFKEIKFPWFNFNEAIDDDYRSDIKVRIGGNHTFQRIESLINEHVPMLADTIIETYIDIARANNRVNWLGWTDESWINHYHIEHGTRTGENSAKNSLKDAGWGSPRVGGHVHSPSEAWNYNYVRSKNILQPDRVIIQSVTLPCLCNIHPHYAGDKKKSRWMNGVGIAYVNLNGLDVHQHKIIFHQRANGDMAAAFGSEMFVQHKLKMLKSA